MILKRCLCKAGVDIAAGQHATGIDEACCSVDPRPKFFRWTGQFWRFVRRVGTQGNGSACSRRLDRWCRHEDEGRCTSGRWDTIGYDIVNHCINDIFKVQGARPVFLDYVASSKLHPEQIATIVGGIAAACRTAGCALLGGETAEMPGVYEPVEIDLDLER